MRTAGQGREVSQIWQCDGDGLRLGHYDLLSLCLCRCYTNWDSEGAGRRSSKTEGKESIFISPADSVCMYAIQSSSKDEALLPSACVWIMSSVLCEGDVTAVGTLGRIRTGKGSGWTLTRKEEIIDTTSA